MPLTAVASATYLKQTTSNSSGVWVSTAAPAGRRLVRIGDVAASTIDRPDGCDVPRLQLPSHQRGIGIDLGEGDRVRSGVAIGAGLVKVQSTSPTAIDQLPGCARVPSASCVLTYAYSDPTGDLAVNDAMPGKQRWTSSDRPVAIDEPFSYITVQLIATRGQTIMSALTITAANVKQGDGAQVGGGRRLPR